MILKRTTQKKDCKFFSVSCPSLCLCGSRPHFRNRGFTLIEVIVTLMLVSVLAAVAGFGIVEVARGYQAARENERMAQTARVALLRMGRELMELETVTNADASSVTIVTPNGTLAMGYFDSEIRLDNDETAVDGDILVDRVDSFQLTYLDMDDAPWNDAMPVEQLAVIDIQLNLARDDGIAPITFSTQINPRNNGILNAPL